MLESILALLVSFASLADRAANLPLCLQLPLFALLARGEDVARSFIIDLPSGALAHVAVSHAHDRAERLAAEFRALARVLRALLARARRLARLSAQPSDRLMLASPVADPRGCRVQASPAPDTS